MEYTQIAVRREGDVAVITRNRPMPAGLDRVAVDAFLAKCTPVFRPPA